jgi:hypothetical protein
MRQEETRAITISLLKSCILELEIIMKACALLSSLEDLVEDSEVY